MNDLKIKVVADDENKIYNLYDENNMQINIPESIAIILDGNGRFAEKMNIERAEGHKAGCVALENILEESVKIGVKFLTVYAFSTENWKRSPTEINALFDLFFIYLNKIYNKAKENNVKVNFIGDFYKFPKNISEKCDFLMSETKNNTRLTFSIAFNYGSRDEIIRAIKKMSKDKISIDDLTESIFNRYLDTYNIKDPDLLIRTSGEIRISNFLLWQIAYSELYFTDVLWPEFTTYEYYKAILSYNKRNRRYGGRK